MESLIEERVTPRGFYPRVTVDRVLERVAAGESIAQIAVDAGMPSRASIYRWLQDDDLNARYLAAVALAASAKK